MKGVLLPGSRRRTSRLGYGTSGLHGGWSRRSSLALLEAAFDSGIRHFDTAPLYGLGSAEDVVGQFLVSHRGQLSITTKFGLSSPRSRVLFEVARGLLKPIVSRFPRAKSQLVRAVGAVSTAGAAPGLVRYSVPAMQASLEQSLRKLRCDRIDVFLLHEADAADINDDLRLALDAQVMKGSIGTWGLGSARPKIDRAIAATPLSFPVLQFEWSVASDRVPVYPGSFIITHGALRDSISWLRAKLEQPGCRQAWSAELGCDLGDSDSAARLLLGVAAAANPDGLVLFTSKTPAHVRKLASLGAADEQAGERFLSMLS
jgi:aryl-alcohol dehydrogenase-like predicted oxidoreductase